MTAPTVTPDTLEELDFAIACACASDCCPGHEKGSECGADAVAIITLHILGHCDDDACDPDGNTVGPICQQCIDNILQALAALLGHGIVAMCGSCGAPIALVSDVIRDVRPLR